jgi:hypothetical protein
MGNWPSSGTTPKVLVPPGPGSPWTLVATSTLTVAANHQHSPAVFPPFVLPTGSYGLAFEVGPVTAVVPNITVMPPPYALHPWLLVAASAPGAPLTASDQFLSIGNEDITNQAFVTAPLATPKGPIFDLHYTVAAGSACFTPYGSGCYDRPQSFYQAFAAGPSSFDLSNSTLQLIPAISSYAIAAGTTAIVAPITAPLTVSPRTPPLPLGFSFPYPGGATTNIVITANGNIFLDPASSGAQSVPFSSAGVVGFLRGPLQLAAFWGNLNPSAGGSVHLDIDLLAPVARVTWTNVPEFGVPGSANTFQVAMYGNGIVDYRYGACAAIHEPVLVGWSHGGSMHDPGNRDLSATLPFSTGDGTVPPDLSMSARPVLGTTPNFVVGDLPAAGAGLVLLGAPRPALDLGGLGMHGCMQQVSPIAWLAFLATGPSVAVAASVPNHPALLGVQCTGQAMAPSPGSNAAGITVSNPLCIRLGR